MSILSSSEINQAVCHATPGINQTESFFLSCAETFRKGYLMARRAYLVIHNPVSFAAGSALSLALGQNNTLMQIARIILGVLSILRCSEDLHKLRALQKKCSRILSGKEYVPIKGDHFGIGSSNGQKSPRFLDQAQFACKIRMERLALFIQTLGAMMKVFGELMLHLGDAYVAFNEDCSSEVFIHSRDLWEELSSDQSYLVMQLKNNEAFNDWILGRMHTKTSLCTQMLMGLIAVPSQVRSAMPDMRDISSRAKDTVDDISHYVKISIQDCRMGLRELRGIDPWINSHDHYSFEKGSDKDPALTRWIKPPKKIFIKEARSI